MLCTHEGKKKHMQTLPIVFAYSRIMYHIRNIHKTWKCNSKCLSNNPSCLRTQEQFLMLLTQCATFLELRIPIYIPPCCSGPAISVQIFVLWFTVEMFSVSQDLSFDPNVGATKWTIFVSSPIKTDRPTVLPAVCRLNLEIWSDLTDYVVFIYLIPYFL